MNDEGLNPPFFSLTMGPEGIVRLTWIPNIEIGLDAAKASAVAVNTLCQGKLHPILIDMRSAKSITREARAFYVGPEIIATNAIALLVASAVSQIIANFFMRINKPTIPTNMFTSEAAAIEWLKEFLEFLTTNPKDPKK